MKEYQKALEAYDRGLQLEGDNAELTESVQRTLQAMQSGQSEQERLENAMRDPEIQEILSDPAMRQILEDMKTSPAAAKEYDTDIIHV